MFYLHILNIINTTSVVNTCRLYITVTQPNVVLVHKDHSKVIFRAIGVYSETEYHHCSLDKNCTVKALPIVFEAEKKLEKGEKIIELDVNLTPKMEIC